MNLIKVAFGRTCPFLIFQGFFSLNDNTCSGKHYRSSRFKNFATSIYTIFRFLLVVFSEVFEFLQGSFQKQPPEVFCKEGVLRIFKIHWKTPAPVSFLIKLEAAPKKRLWHRCFPVNFAKFLWAPFSQNTSGWLLQSFEEGNLYLTSVFFSHLFALC